LRQEATNGSRECDKIYFKVKDVGQEFDMENLQNIVIKNNTRYTLDTDYKFFICNKKNNILNKTGKKQQVIKELFLTYEGMLRVLFVSNNGKTNKFIKWATEKLFTIQMGTTDQKIRMASDILGTDAKSVTEVFNKNSKSLPCVYLFTLGYVKDLRQSMSIDNNIDDNSIVAKYGFTKDLSRRTNEHMKKYGKITNCELKLKTYSYIDPQYMSNAESDIRSCMNALNIHMSYNSETELVTLNSSYMKIALTQFENISSKYMGHVSELITLLKDSENKNMLEVEKHKNELLIETHRNDLMVERYENMLLKKDMEIMKLTYGKTN
jgi:hypothetical protein